MEPNRKHQAAHSAKAKTAGFLVRVGTVCYQYAARVEERPLGIVESDAMLADVGGLVPAVPLKGSGHHLPSLAMLLLPQPVTGA